MLAYVDPILRPVGGYVGHMLGICWVSWAYVDPMLAYVDPMLRPVGGYVGHMLGICRVSWAYVGDM